MKKTIAIITIIIFTLFFIIFLVVKNSSNYIYKDDIVKKMKNKESFLIYIYNDKCENCIIANEIIDFYKDNYNLEFYIINSERVSKKEKTLLENIFEFEKDYIVTPAIIVIVNGKVVAVANEIIDDLDLKNYLLDYGMLDKKYDDRGNILTYEEFKERFATNDTNVILISSYDKEGYKLRKKLLDMSQKNKFNYKYIYYRNSDSFEIYKYVIENMETPKIELPIVVIIENNKIVDSISSYKEKEIKKFLIKNNIIN